LFLLVGILVATLLVLEHPTWKVTWLLALSVWCFCQPSPGRVARLPSRGGSQAERSNAEFGRRLRLGEGRFYYFAFYVIEKYH
jgi:hypothetical protein